MAKGAPTRAKSVAKLLDAAFDVFAEKGFHGASIGEICTRAALSRGAFYSNFGDKETLFFALFERYADREVERLEKVLADGGSVDDVVARIGSARDDEEARIAAQWFVLSTEFTIHAIRNPEHRPALADHDRRLRQRIVAALESRLSEREQAGTDRLVDPDLLARLLVAVHEGAMMQSLVEPGALPEGLLTQEFLAQMLSSTRP